MQKQLEEINKSQARKTRELFEHFSRIEFEPTRILLHKIAEGSEAVLEDDEALLDGAKAFVEILSKHPSLERTPELLIGLPVIDGTRGFKPQLEKEAIQILGFGALALGLQELTLKRYFDVLMQVAVGADALNRLLRNVLLGIPLNLGNMFTIPDPETLIDMADEMMRMGCVGAVMQAAAKVGRAAATNRVTTPNYQITGLTPNRGCSGDLIKISGKFPAEQPPDTEIWFPIHNGGCAKVVVEDWKHNEITVRAPDNVGRGCVGFKKFTGDYNEVLGAVQKFANEVKACFGAAFPLAAQNLAGAPLFVCPACLPDNSNFFRGGPPYIVMFQANNKTTVTLKPGSPLVLSWMVDGADQIDIVNIPVGGQRNELPIIGGPFNPEVLDPVSGRKQLNISATYTWNGIYELRARNRCMSHHEYVSKQVSVQMQVPFDPSPGNFLWGVATAGRQFEGGLTADDWQIFTTSPEIISRLNYNKQIGNQWLGQNLKFDIKDAGDALRHWNLAIFREELDRARALGLNAYRISIEWSRVETSRFNFDEAALANYQAMINEIRKRVMEPIVVLNHMSLPAWVLTPPKQTTFLFPTILQTADANDPDFKKQPGWENEDTADMFIEYVQKVVSKLKDKVTYWITFNEPFGTIIPTGYLAGVFPPGFLAAGDRVKRVADTIINAHVRAYHAIKDIDPEAKVGITDQWLLCKPKTDNDRDVAATDQYIYFHQDYLLNAVVKGEYHPNFRQGDADTRRVLDIPTEKWQPAVDFIGLQYYKSVYVSFIVPSSMWWPYYYSGSGDSALFEPVPDMDISRANYPHNLLNDMGWEMYPEGLYKCLLKLRDNYKNKDGVSIPVLISENGTAEIVDRNRAAFITAHIDQMFRAINEGAHVIGYLHWSIADNWEWIDGYRPEVRFGLFSVDRNQNNLPHHITEGALALQYVVAENKAQQARDNFGYYTSQGDAVKPPKKTAGALWEGKLDDGTKFTLYVSRFTVRDSAEAIDPARSFLGMICYHNTHSWVRLETFYWDNEVGILHFCHSGVEEIGIPARVFEAQPDADNKLNGNASELEEDFPGKLRLCFKTLNWQAQRVIHYGIWNGDLVRRQSREQSMPFTLFFSQMEGDFSGWHGKILFHDDPLPEWEPLNNLHIHATVGMPFDCLVYRPQGSIFISGAIAGRDGMGCDMMIGEFIPLPGNFLSWQATKAPDDLPF